MAVKQHAKRGSVSLSMVSIVLLQGVYVWDALYNEKAILTTMDITTDGLGYIYFLFSFFSNVCVYILCLYPLALASCFVSETWPGFHSYTPCKPATWWITIRICRCGLLLPYY